MIDKRKETREKAVALRYDAERDAAPRVTAKGAGLLAQRIIEIAKQNGIYIHDDPDLVAVLSKLDVETQIPEPLYRAVAEVLACLGKPRPDLAERHAHDARALVRRYARRVADLCSKDAWWA